MALTEAPTGRELGRVEGPWRVVWPKDLVLIKIRHYKPEDAPANGPSGRMPQAMTPHDAH